MTRIIVALNPPERNADFIYLAKLVAGSLATEPLFAEATPPLAVFEAHIADLVAAEAHTLTRTRGAASERNAMRAVVYSDLRHVRSFVQRIADGRPADAASIAERSGMSVKRSSGHGKADFDVKPGRVEGSVHLYARAAKTRSSYDWQHSSDGVTWVPVASTVRADTVITDLAPRTRQYFRFRRNTKDGVGDWSQVVSVLVY
jgi:hypothetical protein